MNEPDPQLGGILLYVIALVYVAAVLWLLCWGVIALTRGYRTWRARRVTCDCPCRCGRPGQRDDDGTPGRCDPCRMNIHAEDAGATLASIYAAMDAREQGQP